MKTIRAILFVPVSFLVITGIAYLFGLFCVFALQSFFGWHDKLGTFWFVVLLFLIGIVLFRWTWDFLLMIVGFLMGLLLLLSPSRKFSMWTISIFAILNCILTMIGVWVNITPFAWSILIIDLIVSYLLIQLTFAMCISSSYLKE